ncbi:hypothetical protein CBM2595_A30365 [Cupriavidus taiwanensis]|nr:hypothetical protein CBM2595_A30365 [Cupriavidus taiwanensis]
MGKTLWIQTVRSLLHELSTGHPQCSPLPLWTNPDFLGDRAPRDPAADHTTVCLFFKQQDVPSFESRSYAISQVAFHKPSTALSR